MCREGKFVGTCALIVSDCSANGIFQKCQKCLRKKLYHGKIWLVKP